ncbi:hypothetical protein J4480_03130 [Candidatus Woesearchaeota archaeon]|nr:hypothetical protein [Candidatus Woesearchaeota archaeon]
MAFHLLSLALAGILSFADYITENIYSNKVRANKKLISFSAGVAISYVVLNLFPEISQYAVIDGKEIFLYALFGFISLNLIEQYIHKGVKKSKIDYYHKSLHVAYFFIYNIFIGIVLVNFAAKGIAKTLLFFIPFLLYIIIKIIPQEFGFKTGTFKIFYSLAPLFGAVLGLVYYDLTSLMFSKMLAFITGTLLYTVIRESMPSDEAEKPLYFMIGALFYALVILAGWKII